MKEISALPIFAKVVELGSFAHAARDMRVPTTTVSRKIQQLEAELGGKLLNRSTRSLSLTELGQQVLPKAQLIADTVSELHSDAEEFSTQPVGTLTITAPRALGQDLLAPLLTEFQQTFPTISINLLSSNRFQDLTKQNIDFAFRLGPLHDSSMVALSVSDVRYSLFASKEFLKKWNRPQHPLDLYQMPLIRNHVEGFFLPWRFDNGVEQVEISANGQFVSDDFNTTQQLVLHGAGVGFLPNSLFRESDVSPIVESLLQDWIPQDRSMLLVYQDRRFLPLKSQLFIEFVKQKRDYFQHALS